MTASIVIILSVLVIGVIAEFKNPKRSYIKWIIVALLVLVAILTVYKESLDASSKLFTSGTCPLKFTDSGNSEYELAIGALITPFSENRPAVHQWGNQVNTDVIRASVDDGVLGLDMEIRGYNGDILAYVRGEYWQAMTPGVEFNCDNKAVELKDSKGNVVFQLMLEGRKIVVFGSFVFTPEKFHCFTPTGVMLGMPIEEYGTCKLKEMFKYPASIYKGVRVSDSI